MTQLSQKIVKCPNCGTKNRIIYYTSINTFLDIDGNLISRLLDGSINTSKCNNCGKMIRFAVDILINSPSGMFYLNPKDNMEYKKNQLELHGVLSEKGVIISGLSSQFKEAKKKLNMKDNYKHSPLPPPAPKVSTHTKRYNELVEKLNKLLLKNKKTEGNKDPNSSAEQPKPPPSPPY